MIDLDSYEILKEKFGYDTFKYPQDYIIDRVLEGKDVIGVLPTGFGKSIIFQVLSLLLEGVSIVVSPLIALMEDQLSTLKKKNIPAAILNSNLTYERQEQIYKNLIKNQYKLLYVSPERLENMRFMKYIRSCTVSMVVVDEAHTILWAEGFREAFGRIHRFIDEVGARPRLLALTATATQITLQKIISYLHLQHPLIIEAPMDRKNLFYRVIFEENKFAFIYPYLSKHRKEKGILYCLTRKEAEQVNNNLIQHGFLSTIYHGGLSPEIKNKNQQDFTNGSATIMVCTNAFGMGIDIPNIRYVIEYSLPQSLEDLVQQMGRASRDGSYGEGIVLFSFKDIKTIDYFIAQVEDPLVKKQAIKKRDALIDYCLTKKCRHHFIGKYFNQKIDSCIKFCDNCFKQHR